MLLLLLSLLSPSRRRRRRFSRVAKKNAKKRIILLTSNGIKLIQNDERRLLSWPLSSFAERMPRSGWRVNEEDKLRHVQLAGAQFGLYPIEFNDNQFLSSRSHSQVFQVAPTSDLSRDWISSI